MRGARPLLFVLTLILMLGSSVIVYSQSSSDCKHLVDLLVETKVVSTGQVNSSSIELKFDDTSLKDYAILVTGPDKEPKIFKHKEKKFDDLKPGQYDILIIDRRGCFKQLIIKVK